jgi:hypothetical protein
MSDDFPPTLLEIKAGKGKKKKGRQHEPRYVQALNGGVDPRNIRNACLRAVKKMPRDCFAITSDHQIIVVFGKIQARLHDLV